MSSSVPPYFQEKFSLFQELTRTYSKWLSIGASTAAGFLVLAFYFQSGPKAAAFAEAKRTFVQWMERPYDEHRLTGLVHALQKMPQLKEKYEPILVQKFIEGGRGGEVLDLAAKAIALAKTETPLHAAYAETTLLIEQEQYQLSLERAVALKTKMASEGGVIHLLENPAFGGAVLYGYNLVRIAFLQQELGNGPGEKAAWEELETFLSLIGEEMAQPLSRGLEEKGFSLTDYIRERKGMLERQL